MENEEWDFLAWDSRFSELENRYGFETAMLIDEIESGCGTNVIKDKDGVIRWKRRGE